MKVLFTVQGEGRGHLTQALAMQEMLQRRGHEVVAVLVGGNGARRLPDYFGAAFQAPVREILSPGFALQGGRGVALGATVRRWLWELPRYRRSLQVIDDTLRRARPDVIINFLEPLMGAYHGIGGPRVPTLAVGHQFMLQHPAFVRPPRYRLQQLAMRAYLQVTGAGAARLALSFYPAKDQTARGLYVCPPLLRRQLFALEPRRGDYLLVYLLNHGYAGALHAWHRAHPEVPVHCFCDRPGAPEEECAAPGLTFHRLHGEKFLRLMAGARGVVCTAGFESVSEAAYLGKPLLLIPVGNHVEQYLNACDAEQAGIGMKDSDFRLMRLLSPQAKAAAPEIRRWIGHAETIAMQVVETVAGLRSAAELPAPASAPVSAGAGGAPEDAVVRAGFGCPLWRHRGGSGQSGGSPGLKSLLPLGRTYPPGGSVSG